MSFNVLHILLLLLIHDCFGQQPDEIQGQIPITDSTENEMRELYRRSKFRSVGNKNETAHRLESTFQNDTAPLPTSLVGSANLTNFSKVEMNSTLKQRAVDNYAENLAFESGLPISVKVLHGEGAAISISETSHRKRLPEILMKPNLNVYSIDYLYNESVVFFTAHDKLYRATLEGRSAISKPEEIVVTEVDGPVRLAVDWIHGRLYWMADRYQTVMTSDLDGGHRRLLFDNIRNFTFPNNIAVDPYEGSLFFVSNHAVYRSDLAGDNLTQVTLEGNTPGEVGRGVRCLALDRARRKLYISGRNHPGAEEEYYLARADYDGSALDDLNSTALGDVYSMDVLGNTLYFAQHKDALCHDELMAVDVTAAEFRPNRVFVPRRCRSDMWSIKAYHPCAQRPSNDSYCKILYG